MLPLGGPLSPLRGVSGFETAAAQSGPGWMTAEQAALFTNGWPALVPSYVPEPFAGVTPSISVTGGSYQLYWYVAGDVPTYLEVTGRTDGYSPAGSAYDLNVQLVVNASVRGYEAYHDLTPIYDTVYWRENGIAYSVSSRNLPTDVVSYANGSTAVSAPAVIPTATGAPSASLFSPDSVASADVATVAASGGGSEATLVADGGIFPDTGTSEYPGIGDAAVSWVAPDVRVDTTVTFSLLDANGVVLFSTSTLVTAGGASIGLSLDCVASIAVGQTVPIVVTGSGRVSLGAGAGSWPAVPPNTDYDPGTGGATLAFTFVGGESVTLIWKAPETAQTATLSVSGSTGVAPASCQVEIMAPEQTVEATVPTPTVPTPTVPAPTVTGITSTATSEAPAPIATATASGITPGDGLDPSLGTVPSPPVPGTNPGDGIDADQSGVAASATEVGGDGTDLGGATTLPPRSEYPAIPTSAPLPDAPPISTSPTGVPAVSVTASPSVGSAAGPVATAAAPASTARPGPTTTIRQATVRSTPAAPSFTPAVPTATASSPTATSRPSTSTSAPLPMATAEPPTPIARTAPPTATVQSPALNEGSPGARFQPGPSATAARLSPTPTVATAPRTVTAPPTTTVTALPRLATPTSALATSTPPAATVTVVPSPSATVTPRPPATATSTPVRPSQVLRATEAPSASPSSTRSSEVPSDQQAIAAPASPATPPATPMPTSVATMESVAERIGPAGGTIEHPAGGRLVFAEGAFDATMIVSMTQMPDTDLPISSDVDLIPSTGYEIEISGADGVAIAALPAGVTLSVTVPAAQRDDAVVYWIDGDQLTRLDVTTRESGGVSAPLTHLSRYVAGMPIDEKPELGWLPWAVAVAAALSVLIAAGLLAAQARRRRGRAAGGRPSSR